MKAILSPTPETVHWGYFDGSLRPALTVRSGDTVEITSVSGGLQELPPGQKFTVLQEHRAILDCCKPQIGPHILTGPVAVEGAQLGDTLEVRIETIELIQDWGFNYNRPGKGTLPARFEETSLFHIGIDVEASIGLCPWGTELPLRPFFGILAVAPAISEGKVSTIEPREFGGNIDNKELVAGTTLFLPVFADGGLFSVGDGHACQGDGEVNLTALETALRGRFQLILHKRNVLPLPRATTISHFITMGFDRDLDRAAEIALSQMLDAIIGCSQLKDSEAYALCSMACDLRITQIVDGKKGVHAMMPRSLLPGVQDIDFAVQREGASADDPCSDGL